MTDNKNEKVVHTRISKELYDKISTKAKKHRITTSNLLRTLVEDYLELHGEAWDIIDNKIRSYLSSNEDSIVGYQPITLSKDTKCSLCKKSLEKDSKVFVGFFEKSSQKIIVCSDCKEKEEKD